MCTDSWFRQFEREDALRQERLDIAREALSLERENKYWCGVHSWNEPNHTGYYDFEVYRSRDNRYRWCAVSSSGQSVGCESEPFATAHAAYMDAMK